MRNGLLLLVPLVLAATAPRAGFEPSPAVPTTLSSARSAAAAVQDATRLTADQVMRMPKIDAHAHLGAVDSADRDAFVRFLERIDLRWLTIATGGMNAARLDHQIESMEGYHRAAPARKSAGQLPSTCPGGAVRGGPTPRARPSPTGSQRAPWP